MVAAPGIDEERIMGDKLNEWIDANSATLQALSGPGQPGIPPSAIPGAAGAPGAPPPGPAFPPGQPEAAGGFPAPQAAAGPGPIDYSSAFPPEPTPEQMATAQGAQPPAFDMPMMQPPQAEPVEIGGPQPGQPPPAAAPKPKPKKDAIGMEQVMKDADPKQIDEAIKVMETASGKSIEELYTAQSGAPPPEGMSKRKLGQALFEFGLNLMSAPAGLSDVETIGRAGQATIAGRRQREEREEQKLVAAEDRRVAAQERAAGRLDKKFDRAVTLERLDLERQRVQAALDKPVGEFKDYIGEDGYWYTYNAEKNEGRRMVIDGKPFKANKDAIATKQRRLDSEVRRNMYMSVHGKWPDGTAKTGKDLYEANVKALEYANRVRPYTRAEAVRDATKLAVPELLKDTNYMVAEDEERQAMKRRLIDDYADSFMAGNSSDGSIPDASRLTEGVATAVTNDAGITEYWMLKDGEPTKVPESQLVR